ncbi:hypothetical protein NJB1728f31_27110, partial [Mycobacterium marinum]
MGTWAAAIPAAATSATKTRVGEIRATT